MTSIDGEPTASALFGRSSRPILFNGQPAAVSWPNSQADAAGLLWTVGYMLCGHQRKYRTQAATAMLRMDCRNPSHFDNGSPPWVECYAPFWPLPSDRLDLDLALIAS